MKEETFPDLEGVKKLTTLNLAEDIRRWIDAEPDRNQELFAEMAGISLRTLQSIVAYKGVGEESNWRRTTKEGIMRVLRCEDFYTPEHEIK